MPPDSQNPTLAVESLVTHFPIRNSFGIRTGWLRALDGVTLDVAPGEVLGVVGESGCGKSTFGKTLCGIHRASGGRIVFQGEDATHAGSAQAKRLRRKLQYCYQDPSASLDPNWTIGRSLAEPLVIHTRLSAAERMARVHAALEDVGLAREHLSLYPHEISGGQQRRVGLARILMLQPSLVVLDEPTAGLDLSVQARVLRLLMDLRERHALSYIFISHDLSVVRLICRRVAVMYLGRVVEIGPAEAVFGAPSHPYTAALLSALPVVGGERISERFRLEGEPPSPGRLPGGCRFRQRCPRAGPACAQQEPELTPGGEGHAVACHFPLAS
ncbi:MAG: ATP-binding cassette domain-containing protein [Rhodospirillales bacterium]|nr:ATP-binding cassette domain-containing protein [Rhodospirillales bacterium]